MRAKVLAQPAAMQSTPQAHGEYAPLAANAHAIISRCDAVF
jgi:hypothetical protein